MKHYQMGEPITDLVQKSNYDKESSKIVNFVQNNIYNIRSLFIVSSLLNFNVKEMFHSVIKDYMLDYLYSPSSKSFLKDNKECLIF
jgi:hypothetical protein